MAFSRTPAAAQYVSKGPVAVASHFSGNRVYSLSDWYVYQERHWAKLDAALRAELAVIPVDDPEPKVIQDVESPIKFAITTASSSGTNNNDTMSLLDTDLAFIQAGDVFEVNGVFCDADGSNYETDKNTALAAGYFPETVIVQSVTPGATDATHGTIVVSRGNGNDPSSATQIATTMHIVYIGNSLVDGGNAPSPVHYEPSHIQNYCQLFSKTWGMTDSDKRLDVYGKMSMADRAARKRKEFFRLKELAYFRGRKASKTVNQNTQWMTGGMFEFTPGASTALDGVSRLFNFGGPFDLDTYQEKTEIIGRYGSDTKHWWVGGKFLTSLWKHFQSSITFNDTVSRRYGWSVWELDLGHTIAMLHRHPIFTDISATSEDYNYDAQIIDLKFIKQMIYIDVMTRENVQANNAHSQINEIFGQSGLWRTYATAHAYIYGITS